MEDGDAVDDAVFGFVRRFAEFLQALLEGPLELGLFFFQFFLDLGFVFRQFRIRVLIFIDEGLSHILQAAVRQVDVSAVAHRPADDPPKHIALVHVGGGDALPVADHHSGGPGVVQYDPEGSGDFRVFSVFLSGQFFDDFDGIFKQVGIVNAFLAVHDAGDSLQPHAGVDVFLGQRFELAFADFIVFHEYVVPDLQEGAAVAVRTAVRAALGPPDQEHFTVRAAGTGQACRAPPVVLLGQEVDVFFFDALFFPQSGGIFILRCIFIPFEAGHCQLVRRDAQVFFVCQEFVAPGDLFIFEEIAQGPVPQHFKEGTVGIVPYFIDIAGPDAFLHVGEPGAFRVLFTQKIGYQRVHPRSGEQDRRVILRDQGRGGDDAVALAFKEIQV